MKALKLRPIDKWGLAVVLGLFAALLGWHFFPPHRCEVHGQWLKRERAGVVYRHMAMTRDYAQKQNRAKSKLFPHTGDLVRQAAGMEQFLRFEFVRYCRKCREAEREWRRGRFE